MILHNFNSILLIFLSALLFSVASEDQFHLVGYMPEWRHEGADFPRLAKHLSHLILFSLEVTPKGDIRGLDRLPRQALLEEAKATAEKEGTKLLVCFGGNGRSGGFSVMVRNSQNRKNFVSSLVKLLDEYSLHGVDYNWEYPGYRMGRGYMTESEILKDYEGLVSLLRETREVFRSTGRQITMAYYPDSRQESLLELVGATEFVDLIHSMSYDQGGSNHSPRDLAVKTIQQARRAGLPLHKLCLGVPFYGRNDVNGDWTTYEDLVQAHQLEDDQDQVRFEQNDREVTVGFNGRSTLVWKLELAVKEGLGGVMIWEVGQDCRVDQVVRGDQVHVTTCPRGEDSSLLSALVGAKDRILQDRKDEL